MTRFARVAVKVVASTGFCVAVTVLSPNAAATPLKTGGYKCLDAAAGTAAPGVAGAPCAAAAVEASGVVAPLAPPVPVVPAGIPPVPVVPAGVPPVLLAPPVPVVPAAAGAPIAAAAGPVGAPVTDLAGAATGKEAPTSRPADADGPTPGVPLQPGPQG
ncbi:hypothetical protein [Mycobacterium sp. 141]|uniref:hypothetical protein n=1 Tax=Mycobacterium sp. 141 TaxID=1120797 RepID=UPI0005645886|nr:hypothetical protein [Mycobacterium sp. 141]